MDERIPGRTTFRVMGPHERGRFAPEAWGHLLSLNGSGAINGLELEHIIERALIHQSRRRRERSRRRKRTMRTILSAWLHLARNRRVSGEGEDHREIPR